MAFSGAGKGGGLGNASILRMARLLRLTRMARMARLLRAMPELLILIKGMVAAMRSVMFTLGLLMVIIYIFAIAFTQLSDETPCADVFSSVPESMHYLLIKGALMDSVSEVTEILQPQSIVLLLVFYMFVLLASLTVMNMLIGVICEVVSAVAATEQEVSMVCYVKEKIEELMASGSTDGDNMISKEEFKGMLENKKALTILNDVGVDVVSLPDFTDTIFEPDEDGQPKPLNFSEFMNVVLDLRGTNTATVKDVVQLRRFVNARVETLERKLVECSPDIRNRFGSLLSNGSHIASSNSNKSEPVKQRSEAAPKLRELINQSLEELICLQESQMRHLRAQNEELQAKLSKIAETPPLQSLTHTSSEEDAKLSKVADTPPLRSLANATSEEDVAAIVPENMQTAALASIDLSSENMKTTALASIDLKSENMRTTALASIEQELSRRQVILASKNAESLNGNNHHGSNGWATKSDHHLTQQSLDGTFTEAISSRTTMPAMRGDARVQPCNCPPPHLIRRPQVGGTKAATAWGSFNQAGP